MKKRYLLVLFIVAFLLLLGSTVLGADTQNVYIEGKSNYDYAYQVLDLVNEERANAGLSALKMDSDLLDAAMERAAETAIYFSHTRPNGTTCFSICNKMFGENIAVGQSNPSRVMTSWMNSSGHKANILGSTYNSIGIGCFYIDGYYFWVQCFGITNAEVPTKRTDSITKTHTIEKANTISDYGEEYISNIKLADTNEMTLKVGNTGKKNIKISNTFTYVTILPQSAKWTSSDTSIAKVDSYGTVTAVKPGTTTITATVGLKSVSFKVTVTLPFTDVSSSQWYYNSVAYCYNNGIIKGTTSTTYSPDKNIIRGDFVVILWRMSGSPTVSKSKTFSDVKSSDYYYNAIQWATSKGIVSGYDNGKFGPKDNITREQLAVMLRNYAKYQSKNSTSTTSITKYTDYKKVSSYATTAVKWAVATGVISGKSNGTKIDPQGKATRAEAAAMIYNYCTKIK